MPHAGFAIAIAWPETYCKQPGAWYDKVSSLFGLSKNNYYKVGHAALVLVDSLGKECHYFDFGRYHAPFRHGRIRSKLTDPRLTIKTKPMTSDDGSRIENFCEILSELQLNAECHGEGKIYASYCSIDFLKAYTETNTYQKESPIPYGPFVYGGSNCSRFVNRSVLSGKPKKVYAFKLKYMLPLTPTPISNVNALSNKLVLPKLLDNPPFYPDRISNRKILKTTLFQPEKQQNIPEAAQWLSGEGAGSWFYIKEKDHNYLITRYSPEGEIECKAVFEIGSQDAFDIKAVYQFIHLSHCNRVKIVQEKMVIEFRNISICN